MSDIIVLTSRFDGNRVVATRVRASRAPGLTDDEPKCYKPGCVWLVNGANDIYQLVVATSGAAVWRKIYSGAAGGAGGGGTP